MKINTLMRRATHAPAPGSDEWKQKITASKVASVVCKSPWASKFALHADMTGRYESDPINPEILEMGNLLEPYVADWYALHNPGVQVRECKKRGAPVWWVDPANEDFAATPDRILVDKVTGEVTALLEIKTARFASEWGEEGTDEIPEHYKLQALWQMKCTGVKTVVLRCYIQVCDLPPIASNGTVTRWQSLRRRQPILWNPYAPGKPLATQRNRRRSRHTRCSAIISLSATVKP